MIGLTLEEQAKCLYKCCTGYTSLFCPYQELLKEPNCPFEDIACLEVTKEAWLDYLKSREINE